MAFIMNTTFPIDLIIKHLNNYHVCTLAAAFINIVIRTLFKVYTFTAACWERRHNIQQKYCPNSALLIVSELFVFTLQSQLLKIK